jgi:hypothetical protein
MTDRRLRMLLALLAGIAGSSMAQAQTPVVLMHDPSVGPIRLSVGQVLIRQGSGLVDMRAIQTYVDRDIQVDRDVPAPPSASPAGSRLP